jgi:hypothetical protein
MSAVARTEVVVVVGFEVVGFEVVGFEVVGFDVVGLDVLPTVLVPTLVVELDGPPPTAVEVELEPMVEVLLTAIALVVVPESPPCDSAMAAAAPPPTPATIPIVFPLTPPPVSPEPLVAFKKLVIPSAWNPGGSDGAPGRVAPTEMFGFSPVKNSAAGLRLLHSLPDETGTVLSSVRKASKLKVTSSR